MAVEIGMATSHSDLLLKLETFLTTNSELVAANQQWEFFFITYKRIVYSSGNTTDTIV